VTASPRRCAAISAVGAVAVVALTIGVHWLCTRNEFLLWDDQSYLARVLEHRPLSLDTVRWAFTSTWIYYQPLTWLSHGLDCWLWGTNSAAHHATGVVLHGVNTALVMMLAWVVVAAIEGLSPGERSVIAVGTGLIFGLQVESVAWLAERNNLICGGFIVASLIAYLRAVRADADRRWWWLTTGLFAAALLSKPMAVPVPLAMLAVDYYPLRRQQRDGWLRLLREKLLLFGLSAGAAALTMFAAVAHEEGLKGFSDLGPGLRVLLVARSLAFYLWKLIWPEWLSPFYPLDHWITVARWDLVGSLVVVVIVTAVAVVARRRSPGALAAWLAYAAMVLPVSGIVQAGAQIAADRYVYVALVPVTLGLVTAGVVVWRRASGLVRTALAVLVACYVAFLGYRTRGQIAVWHTDEVLWRSAQKHFPDSWVPNHQLAGNLVHQQRYAEALEYVQRSLRATPRNPLDHGLLGLVFLKLGDDDRAELAFTNAVKLDRGLWQGWYYLACVQARRGKLAPAWEALTRAVNGDPDYGPKALTEPDLKPLHADPQFGPRLRELTRPSQPPP
jgi:protein O-mannosyl-transferase